MIRFLSLFVALHLSLAEGGALGKGQAQVGHKLLHSDDFSGDLSQWVIEQIPGGKTFLKDGKLEIVDAGGCTVWFKKKLEGPTLIEFEAKMVQEGGKFDRGSDLNCFWMAIDPDNPADLFANKKRGGSFRNYHPLRLYYVGYGANNNTTTRFRRYPGDGSRPCLPEHDLKDAKFLHSPNEILKIQIVANGSTIQYLRNGKVVFDFLDPSPFTDGWFGFRTVRNHLQIDNFKIYRIATVAPKTSKPTYPEWRCHVIQSDPKNHGPDGINIHDWDVDGAPDLFVNYEEGKYSRLYFNPRSGIHSPWDEFVEFRHGKCEDSGIGDLDNDGDIDYIANGGWIFFNPGRDGVRDASRWKKMTLFDQEQRVPTVTDVDGDGLNDLIVGAQTWYKQPEEGKHEAKNWKAFPIGKTRWPMNCILHDVDADGDADLVVPDRGVEVSWFVNPGPDALEGPWERKTLHEHSEPMFMEVADVNDDQIDDFVFAGGNRGKLARKLVVLLRTNRTGIPEFREIVLDQPCGNFPKGVAVIDVERDLPGNEVVVLPKQGDLWMASWSGNPMKTENWKTTPLPSSDSQTRKKMDNAYPIDIDGDGDIDIVTTEENGRWGVIWFENPGNTK